MRGRCWHLTRRRPSTTVMRKPTPLSPACSSLLLERQPDQACTMLRHATGYSSMLSHTDKHTSIRFPLTVDPSPPPSFDDPQQHGYRLDNPQLAPQQHPASGNPDLHALPHALLQPRNWAATQRLIRDERVNRLRPGGCSVSDLPHGG